MLKSNSFKACLLIPAIVFCLNSNGFSKCPPDCPQNLSTTQEEVTTPQDWHFKCDPDNLQEIERNDSVVVEVVGGKSPYTWSVSGTGFSLEESDTSSNTLSADNTACGSATITVKDSSGGPDAVCSVREKTYGDWVEIPTKCLAPGPPTSTGGSGNIVTRIDGKYKQVQRYRDTHRGGGTNAVECKQEDCGFRCAQFSYCDDDWGCTECVRDPYVNDGCNAKGDFPSCFACEFIDPVWHFGVVCPCTVSLQLYEYQCQ